MSIVLADVKRGNIVESRHHGIVAVADGSGKVIASAGDPHVVTYMRSAAKPIQAINTVISGAADEFLLNDDELSIMCASHYGEDIHLRVIERFIKKLGLSEKDLLCGTPLSINIDHMKQQLRGNQKLLASGSCCSGKHCGFLAVCKLKGYPIENYNSPGHPVQKEVLKVLACMSNRKESDIDIGVDGCGVPVHSMSLVNMASCYAKFSTPEQIDEPYRSACTRLYSAMNTAPEMLAGTNGFCTEFLKHTGGKFCGKLGAEAIYCVGVKGKDMGIAIKIEDGNPRALYPVVMSTLMQLDLLSDHEIEALNRFISPVIKNVLGDEVGKIVPSFKLNLM